MLHTNNHSFLEEACKLLVRKRNTTNLAEMVSYNKLFELVISVNKNFDIVNKYITTHKLQSIEIKLP